MGFSCSLLLDCSSFTEVIECSTYLGCCRFSFIPRCSVFLDSLCHSFWRKEPGIWTGGTGLHIYCAWSFFKLHNNSIGCIFLRKKIACISKINWIYHYAFHLQQLKTSGLVWSFILQMDHRLLVNCLQETLPACLSITCGCKEVTPMLILAAKKWEWSMSTASQLHRRGSKE